MSIATYIVPPSRNNPQRYIITVKNANGERVSATGETEEEAWRALADLLESMLAEVAR